MGEPLNERRVRALVEARRGMEALELVDTRLTAEPGDLDAQCLRVECLVAIGRFETALELARAICGRDPDRADVRHTIGYLEHHLVAPATAQRLTTWRDWRTAVPQQLLLRIQQSVHSYTYRGIQMVKDPFDVALYQLLLWRLRPRTIVEVGSKAGGSALFFADLLGSFGGDGHVYSYDVFPVRGVVHDRVTFRFGDGQRLAEAIDDRELAGWPRPWLVVEDADHSYETSIGVLDFFDAHLRGGDWIVVEDGNLSDMYPELFPDGTSGPHRALREFLSRADDRYRIATELCDFFAYNATANSNGFLERLER